MLRGDISNRQAPVLAFNLDNLLFTDKPHKSNLLISFLDKFLGSSIFDKPIDPNFSDLLHNYWIKYDFSIYLVTFNKEFLDEINDLLVDKGICYTRLEGLESLDDLVTKCRYQYMYYIDSDKELLSKIGTTNAISLDELNTIIR